MKDFFVKLILAAVVLLLVLVGADLMTRRMAAKDPIFSQSDDRLYAVFLTNGQVYFGSITAFQTDAVMLKNIFYLQVKQPGGASDTAQGDAALLKLGNELHGPEDWMHINRSQIVFMEKLQPDGKVAKAIRDYKKAD